MATEFKTLLGNRIYIEFPKKEESKIIVDSNTKEALQKELLGRYNKMKVYAIGTGLVESTIKEGDLVLIDPEAITRARIIPLSEDRDVLLISPFDIVHIW